MEIKVAMSFMNSFLLYFPNFDSFSCRTIQLKHVFEKKKKVHNL